MDLNLRTVIGLVHPYAPTITSRVTCLIAPYKENDRITPIDKKEATELILGERAYSVAKEETLTIMGTIPGEYRDGIFIPDSHYGTPYYHVAGNFDNNTDRNKIASLYIPRHLVHEKFTKSE